MKQESNVLGPVARVVGWWCVVSLALLIVDMAMNLPGLPADWWLPPEQAHLAPGGFNLRLMIICPGLSGWLGLWGYMASWLWLPYAAWRAVRDFRGGRSFPTRDRVLLAAVPLLIVVVQLLLRAPPLQYGYPLV